MAALSGAGRSMAGGESPFRGPAPAPEGSPAIVLALRDALRRRNAARLQRRAVAGASSAATARSATATSLVHQAGSSRGCRSWPRDGRVLIRPCLADLARGMIGKTSQGCRRPARRRRSRAGLEEAAMEENFVWMTTRRIKPGTLADFKRTWRPERHPDGMLHAYAYWSDDEQEIIAVSWWVSREACDTWRASWEETRRRAAMAPYVLSEQEGFYRGRELIVPAQPLSARPGSPFRAGGRSSGRCRCDARLARRRRGVPRRGRSAGRRRRRGP